MSAEVTPVSRLPKDPWKAPKNAETGDSVMDENGELLGPLTRVRHLEGKVFDIPVTRFVPRPDQPRLDNKRPDAEELGSDVGQIKPIDAVTFCWRQRRGIYCLIVDGERRYWNGKERGNKELPGRIIWDPSLSRLFETALISNVNYRSLNPMEEAQAFRRAVDGILERGEADDEVAARTLLALRCGKPASYVRERLWFLERLGEEQQQMLRDGRLGAAAALAMCRKRHSDAESQERIAEALSKAPINNKGRIPARVINRALADNGLADDEAPKKRRGERLPDAAYGSPEARLLSKLERSAERTTSLLDTVAEKIGDKAMDEAVKNRRDGMQFHLNELSEAIDSLKTALK